MIRAARAWFHNANTAVAITVGVVAGYAIYRLLEAIAYGTIATTIFEERANGRDLTADLGFVRIYYPAIVTQASAVLMLAALVYLLFIWSGGDPTVEDETTTECPECRSEIWADARRCPFCTSPVLPSKHDQAVD